MEENKIEIIPSKSGYKLTINGVDFSKGTSSVAIVIDGNIAKIQLDSDLNLFLENMKNVKKTPDSEITNITLDGREIISALNTYQNTIKFNKERK